MLIPRSRTVTIDTANPTVPVEVVPAPAAGTTNLLYSIMLMNSDLGARDLDFYLTDGVDTVYLIQERGVAFATRYLYPPEDSEGPLHQVAGWDLMMVTDGFTLSGSWTASVDYAEDTGEGDAPSDYKWALVETPATAGQWTLLASPAANYVRIVKHISISNQDTPTPGLGVHSWLIGKTDGATVAWGDITGNMNVREWKSWWGYGGRTILEYGDSLVGYQILDENASTSCFGVSYIEAGGAAAYSDRGPWTHTA